MVKIINLKDYTGAEMAEPIACFEQADGAWPNNTRVRKINSDFTDAHKDGALATIIGSVLARPGKRVRFVYFVRWDDMPHVPVAIADFRLKLIEV